MYGRFIKFAVNNNVHRSTIKLRIQPSNFFTSMSTGPNHKKKPNLVDDIRESASGLPPTSSSSSSSSASASSGADDRVNVVKTSTTSSSSTSDRSEINNGDMTDFVAHTAKKGVAKAVETGLGIGEMGKKTLDNVWDATKNVSEAVKETVAGDDEKKDDVPADGRFHDGLKKRADWYCLERNQ